MGVLLQQAFMLADELHKDQKRKASSVPDVPYISHLLEVSGMVLASGGSELEAAAALLHDAIEDQGEKVRDRILAECGLEVLYLVQACTEAAPKDTYWQKRKLLYLQHIQSMSLEGLRLSVSDKLQSARELKRQVDLKKDKAYENFAKKDYATLPERKDATIWFHNLLVQSYWNRFYELQKVGGKHMHGVWVYIKEFEEIVVWLGSN